MYIKYIILNKSLINLLYVFDKFFQNVMFRGDDNYLS